MQYEQKTWVTRCDFCGESVTSVGPNPTYPIGWDRVLKYDCGSTGYTMALDRCLKCKEAHKEDPDA